MSSTASAKIVYGVDFNNETSMSSLSYIQVVQRKISASEAKSIARKKVRGAEVLDVSLNGNMYKVRMQKKNGHVIDVKVDATTGRVR